MKRFGKALGVLGLIGFGYVLGASGLFAPEELNAQPGVAAPQGPSTEAVDAIKEANEALNNAAIVLQQEGRYETVTEGVNSYAVLVGGLNAKQDLETGRGVDPETFAALYAGLANDDIAGDINRDEEGRLTYKGKVIRMYPISRLQALSRARAELAGLQVQ